MFKSRMSIIFYTRCTCQNVQPCFMLDINKFRKTEMCRCAFCCASSVMGIFFSQDFMCVKNYIIPDMLPDTGWIRNSEPACPIKKRRTWILWWIMSRIQHMAHVGCQCVTCLQKEWNNSNCYFIIIQGQLLIIAWKTSIILLSLYHKLNWTPHLTSSKS